MAETFTVIGLINGGYIQKRFHDSGSPEERAGVNAWLFSKLFDIDLKDCYIVVIRIFGGENRILRRKPPIATCRKSLTNFIT
jgi:hypothetical protein